MRLSVKLFMALAVLAGSLFGFSPDAAAHRNTGSVAEVAGTVQWFCPGGPAVAGNPLGVKSGLPIGDPATQEAYTTPDCFFSFGTSGLEINSSGLWDGMNQLTAFICGATGKTGASGNDKGVPNAGLPVPTLNPNQAVALGPTFGAFRGDFTCTGASVNALKYNLPGSAGSFQGLTTGGTTIGFLGTINCVGATCPLGTTPGQKNYTTCKVSCKVTGGATSGHVTPDNWGPNPPAGAFDPDHNKSVVSHTVACEGEIVPVAGTGGYFSATDQFAASGAVALDCVIA